MNEIKSFIFYRSYYELIKELPQKQQIELYSAICKYIFEDETIELKGLTGAVLKFILPQLEANKTRYINGCKGGRPKANNNQDETEVEIETEPNKNLNNNQEETKPITKAEPNVNVNVNKNVNNNTPLPPLKQKTKINNKFEILEKIEKSSFSEEVKIAISDWVEYKRYKYQPKGMDSLLTLFAKHIDTYGEQAVIDLVKECMSNLWKGIVWDKLYKRNCKAANTQNCGNNEGILDKWESQYKSYEEAKNETDGERHNRVFGSS